MKEDPHRTPADQAGEPASRAELDRLEASREVPRRDLVLAPSLGGSRDVEAQEVYRRNARIEGLRARLDAASGRASVDFALGQARGRARNEFDRSR